MVEARFHHYYAHAYAHRQGNRSTHLTRHGGIAASPNPNHTCTHVVQFLPPSPILPRFYANAPLQCTGATMSCGAKRKRGGQNSYRFHTLPEVLPPPLPPLPHAAPEYPLPDLTPWAQGNCGIKGVHHFESHKPGPHIAITALMHGNEYAGAHALTQLLSTPLHPAHGRLSLIFLNLEAYAAFDPRRPSQFRFIEEDMNRLWMPHLIRSSHTSLEMRRVRELLPVIDTVDILLDLHTMTWPSATLLLTSMAERNLHMASALANGQAAPPQVVLDHGHPTGPRLIDYERFSAPGGTARACLLEAGQHWTRSAAGQSLLSARQTLALHGMLPVAAQEGLCPSASCVNAMVTDCVEAYTASFAFVRPFVGGEIIEQAGTIIAVDGMDEIRTPYNNCMLVIPNLRPRRGHTAVRLARIL
ncbi:MAG: succinylglutamate desuccinylase/aspartoacylase family protein [Acetobacter syzygii]|uniref:succinylglutamate desuccinylase/aspartoacylase domain-containing protein n=2 Tax=Acetobacter syzygii TaxID=146476 RepID=UPI0039EC3DD1